MSNLNLNRNPALGFESEHIHWNDQYEFRNNIKFLGYIPIIGSFMGVVRLLNLGLAKGNIGRSPAIAREKDFKYLPHTVRGIIETLSLGILFLPVDLGMTGKRKIEQLLLKCPLSKGRGMIGAEFLADLYRNDLKIWIFGFLMDKL